MKCIEEGHVYKLNNYQASQAQELVFMKRIDGELVYDGTTNEEVLTVLIDRVKHLNNILPCKENEIIITNLETALKWIEERTRLRVEQGVEAKDIAHKSLL